MSLKLLLSGGNCSTLSFSQFQSSRNNFQGLAFYECHRTRNPDLYYQSHPFALALQKIGRMQSLLRVGSRLPRNPWLAAPSSLVSQKSLAPTSIRNAHSSYGDKQSGHPEGTNSKDTSHLEHPGPDPPNTGSSASKSASKGTSQSSSSSDKGSPAIQSPESTAEKDNPEVRQHNEEMRQRHERSVNQLSEEDNKVDKQFWTGR
jgi:hypothetical protein